MAESAPVKCFLLGVSQPPKKCPRCAECRPPCKRHCLSLCFALPGRRGPWTAGRGQVRRSARRGLRTPDACTQSADAQDSRKRLRWPCKGEPCRDDPHPTMHRGPRAGRTVRVSGPVAAGVVAPTASCRRERWCQGCSAGNHGVPGDGPEAMPTAQSKQSPTGWQRVGTTKACPRLPPSSHTFLEGQLKPRQTPMAISVPSERTHEP